MVYQLLVNDRIPFRRNGLLQGLIISYVLFWIWMSIEPYNSFGWWLENLLIFAAGVTLLVTYRGFHFTNLSYLQIVLFIALYGSIIAMIVTAVVKVTTNKPVEARQPAEQRRTEAH
jgi:uncharacterized membrane protein YjdF